VKFDYYYYIGFIFNKNITFTKNKIFIYMGRNKIKIEEKKIRVSITINPEINKMVKDKHINLSSLTNKLLKEYFKNENL